MNRSIADSLSQIARASASANAHDPNRLTGHISGINYNARLVRVRVRGYGVIQRAKVAANIILGNQQHPVYGTGDLAELTRDANTKRWKCVSITSKTYCAPHTNSGDVAVDVQFADAYVAQDYGATLTPLSQFPTPTELGGQFSLPGEMPLPGGSAVDWGDGFNGAVASGDTLELLYFATVNIWTLFTISLYTVDSDVTYLVDLNGVNVITATRVGGDWTIQGAGAGSSDLIAGFTLPTPIPIVVGDVIRTAIQADGAVTGLAAGVHGA